MFFIITAAAAVISTIVWYVKAPDNKYKLSMLCFIYWGATLMWFVDHMMAYLTEGGEFLDVSADSALLGVTVVLFGLLIWLAALLIRDPKGVFNKLFQSKR